jgi:hypothetical protein
MLRCDGRLTPSTCLHIVKAFMAFPLARLPYLGAGPGLLAWVPQVLGLLQNTVVLGRQGYNSALTP